MTDKKMKSEIKKAWVDALRSEEYIQTTSRLRSGIISSSGAQAGRHLPSGEYAYCCLGVLCDVGVTMGAFNWEDELHPSGHSRETYVVPMMNQTSLPREVWQWAGLEYDNPVLKISETGEYAGSKQELIEINDTLRYSFEQIADLIEAQL